MKVQQRRHKDGRGDERKDADDERSNRVSSITGAVAFADQDVHNRRRPNKGRQWGLNRNLLYILLTALR